MSRCPNCNYTLVLLEHRRKYKCPKCSGLYTQREIETKEFVKFASQIISGGFFGWNDVPDYVKKSVKYINERLEENKLEKELGG